MLNAISDKLFKLMLECCPDEKFLTRWKPFNSDFVVVSSDLTFHDLTDWPVGIFCADSKSLCLELELISVLCELGLGAGRYGQPYPNKKFE